MTRSEDPRAAPIRILVADDEAPAREELTYILGDLLPDAEFLTARDGGEALRVAAAERVDVAFLDINMPVRDGLSVAANLVDSEDPPLIVFATAYDEHAVKAFELAALDYVVKPFDERRLAGTAKRVTDAMAERSLRDARVASMQSFLGHGEGSSQLKKLLGERPNGSRRLVDFRDILWIEAQSKKVHMHTKPGETLLVRETLKDLEARLEAHHFARVHKGHLVNLDNVVEVIPWFSGGYLVQMADAEGTRLPVSRRYARHLKERTGWS